MHRLVTSPPLVFAELDRERRTISGMLVTWGTVASTGGRRWRFAPGSLRWRSPDRVKLNVDHTKRWVGVATRLADTPTGLSGSFRIVRGPDGDQTLADASDGVYDGFSVEVGFDDSDLRGPDPDDPSVTLVRSGQLGGVALTPVPAFDDARVTSVAASRDRLELRLDADLADGVRAAADRSGTSVSELVRRELRAYTSPRPVYGFGRGPGPSLVRDVWTAAHGDGDPAAGDRLKAFHSWQRDVQARFATVTTGTASEVVEPAYVPLLADVTADRPLYAAAARGLITDATPFNVPDLSEASVGTGVGTPGEGVARPSGSLTFAARPVTPAAVVGRFVATREIVDSSNPAVDAVAMDVMTEDFRRDTETRLFGELNTVQSGVITAGRVPSGAQARTSAGTALPADVRKAVLAFVDVRRHAARSVVASSRTSVAEALESLDMTAFALRDVTVELSPFVTGTAAGDGDVFVTGAGDLRAWQSPLLQVTYLEKQGPGVVELALFGYFAAAVIRPDGVAAVRHT